MNDKYLNMNPGLDKNNVKDFVLSYLAYTKQNFKSEDVRKIVDSVYDKIQIPTRLSKQPIVNEIYNVYKNSFLRMLIVENVKKFNSINNSIDELKQTSNNVATVNYNERYLGINDLYRKLNSFKTRDVDKREEIRSAVAYYYSKLNTSSLSDKELKKCITISANNLYNYHVTKTVTSLNKLDSKINNDMQDTFNEILQDNNKFSYDQIKQECSIIAKVMGIKDFYAYPSLKLEDTKLTLNLDDVDEVNDSNKIFNKVESFIQSSFKIQNKPPKQEYGIEYTDKALNEWNNKKLVISKVTGYPKNSTKEEISLAVNALFAYNMAVLDKEKEVNYKKDLLNFKMKNINLTKIEDEKEFIESFKNISSFKEIKYVRALINTLNMCKFFLNENAYSAVERELSKKIFQSLLYIESNSSLRIEKLVESLKNIGLTFNKAQAKEQEAELRVIVDKLFEQNLNNPSLANAIVKIDNLLKQNNIIDNIAEIKKEIENINITSMKKEPLNSVYTDVVILKLLNDLKQDNFDFNTILLLSKNKFLDYGDVKGMKLNDLLSYKINKLKDAYAENGIEFVGEQPKSPSEFFTLKQYSKNLNKNLTIYDDFNINYEHYKQIYDEVMNIVEYDDKLFKKLVNANLTSIKNLNSYINIENAVLNDANANLSTVNLSSPINKINSFNSNNFNSVVKNIDTNIDALIKDISTNNYSPKLESIFKKYVSKLNLLKENVNELIEYEAQIDMTNYDKYRQNAKFSIGSKLSSYVSKSLGASKVASRRKNPNLIYNNFENIKEEDYPKYNDYIAMLRAQWEVCEANSGAYKSNPAINQISNFITSINETLVEIIEGYGETGKELIAKSAETKNYDELNNAINNIIKDYVKDVKHKEFKTDEEYTQYFMDNVVLETVKVCYNANNVEDKKLGKKMLSSINNEVLVNIKKDLQNYYTKKLGDDVQFIEQEETEEMNLFNINNMCLR